MTARAANLLTLIIIAPVFSCSGPVPTPTPLVDAGFDAGVTTDVDAGIVDAGTGDAGVDSMHDAGTWRIRWSGSPDFPTIIDHHTTFVFRHLDGGESLYVVGGQITDTNALLDGIWSAHIFSDGGLDTWTSVGKLNNARGFHGMTTSPDGVFFAGGISNAASGVAAESEVSVFGMRSDGGLGTFTHSFFPQASLHPTLSAVRGQLVMVGGSGSAGPQASVWTVAHDVDGYEIQADGGVRTLAKRAADLPVARSHHSTVEYNGHLYVIGGFTANDAPLTDVLRSTHDDAGVISGWTVAGTIAVAPWTHSTFVHDNAVFVVGGGSFQTASPWLRQVRRAPFLADGGVGAFVDVLDPLPDGRAHVHQTPVHNGVIYSIGGRVKTLGGYGSTEQVAIGRLVRE